MDHPQPNVLTRKHAVRPAYIVLLLVVLTMAYWSTGRMDTALAQWGLNRDTCYQAFGTTYCGDDADRIEQVKQDLQQP